MAGWGDAQRERKEVTCRDYVIVVRFLERCANNFSWWDENLSNELCSAVTWGKRRCQFIVRLKAIEYKEDFFCYLSSYLPDLGLQAACLLTLFFRPHAFRTSYPWRNAFVYPSFGSQIRSNNLNPHSLSPSLTQWLTSHSNRVDQTPGSRTRCVQRVVHPTTRMVVPKA